MCHLSMNMSKFPSPTYRVYSLYDTLKKGNLKIVARENTLNLEKSLVVPLCVVDSYNHQMTSTKDWNNNENIRWCRKTKENQQ